MLLSMQHGMGFAYMLCSTQKKASKEARRQEPAHSDLVSSSLKLNHWPKSCSGAKLSRGNFEASKQKTRFNRFFFSCWHEQELIFARSMSMTDCIEEKWPGWLSECRREKVSASDSHLLNLGWTKETLLCREGKDSCPLSSLPYFMFCVTI